MKLAELIIPTGFVFVGAYAVCVLTYRMWLADRSKSWPHVMGSVTELTWERNVKIDGDEDRLYPRVRYQYHVDGTLYENTTGVYRILDQGGTREWVDSELARYTVGGKTPVFYNPNDPSHSVLERGASATTYITIFLSMLLMALGVWWILQRLN